MEKELLQAFAISCKLGELKENLRKMEQTLKDLQEANKKGIQVATLNA